MFAVIGLSGLAFAQPVLGAMNAGYFITHRARPLDLVLVALIVVLVPPALVLAFEALVARLRPSLLPGIHVAVMGGLGAIAVSQLFVSKLGWSSRTAVGLVAGAVFAVAYWHAEGVRSFASALAIAPLATFVWFLFVAPTSHVVFAKRVQRDDAVAAHSRTPVVIVVMDELPTTTIMGRDGRIDRGLYPNFARLGDEATWYRYATTPHVSTERAVPAIFTGMLSAADSQPAEWDHRRSLFTLLGGGYRMHVSEPYTQVCPLSLCADEERQSVAGRIGSTLDNIGRLSARRYLPNRIAERFRTIDQWRDYDSPEQQVASFTRGLRPGRRPSLNVLHVILPHAPWRYLPTGERYNSGFDLKQGMTAGDRLSEEKWGVVDRYQRHVLQTQYADRMVGRVLDRLKAVGLWDSSVFVLMADHGTSVRPGQPPRTMPTRSGLQDVMAMPLLVKAPGQRRGGTSDRFVRTLDVLPTVAQLTHTRIPWRVDGRSMLSPASNRRELKVYFGGRSLTVSRDFLRRRLRQVVPPRDALLATRKLGGDSFAIGPHPELIGHRLPRSLPRARGSVSLAGGDLLHTARGRPSVIRALLGGGVVGLPAGQPLAIAVAGRIVATTWTYTSPARGVSFTAMLRPSVVRSRGRITVLTVSGRGKRLRLARLG